MMRKFSHDVSEPHIILFERVPLLLSLALFFSNCQLWFPLYYQSNLIPYKLLKKLYLDINRNQVDKTKSVSIWLFWM